MSFLLCCAQRCVPNLSQADAKARIAGASHHIDQRCGLDHTNTGLLIVKSSSRYTHEHILPTIFQKCSEGPFFKCFEVQFELSLRCVLVQHFCQIEAHNRGNRETTSATPGATLPQKTQSFAHDSVFTREFTHSRTVALPDYLMMGG